MQRLEHLNAAIATSYKFTPDLIAHLLKLPGAPAMINPSPAHIVAELLTTLADMATAKPRLRTYLESAGTVILSHHQILAATSWDALAYKLIRNKRASIPINNSKCTYSPLARQLNFVAARKQVTSSTTLPPWKRLTRNTLPTPKTLLTQRSSRRTRRP